MLKQNRINCHCTFDAKANQIKLRYRKQYYSKNYNKISYYNKTYLLINFAKFIYRNISMTIYSEKRNVLYIINKIKYIIVMY